MRFAPISLGCGLLRKLKPKTTDCGFVLLTLTYHIPLALLAGLAPGANGIAAEITVIRDTFENGSVPNSDSIPALWTTTLYPYSSITETDNKLRFVAGGAGSPGGVNAPLLITGGQTNHAYNFIAGPKRYQADVSITGDVPSNSYLQFSIASEVIYSFGASDAVTLILRADNRATLAAKQDRANALTQTDKILVNNADLGAAITGFALTLDASSYTLAITTEGTPSIHTFTGAHGLTAAQWGDDGKASLQFEAIRGPASTAGQATSATIDNFIVTSLATPAVFEDRFNNGIVADSDLEPGIWTSLLPQASTTVENGRLAVTAATNAGATSLFAGVTTPTQARFNFFERQLRIEAQVTATGNCTAFASERARLSLLSQSGLTADAANDALTISVHGFVVESDSIGLSAKQDAPNTSIEFSSSANARRLVEPVGNFAGGGPNTRIDFIINRDRYQLRSYGPGSASRILRFSGAHKLQQANWGVRGDSSLLLETYRYNEPKASAVATSVWDDLRVETDSTRILDEPFWKFSTIYQTPAAASTGNTYLARTQNGLYRLWLPSTESTIRGLIIMSPGDSCDFRCGVHDPVAQEAARSLGFGLLGYDTNSRMSLDAAGISENKIAYVRASLQAVLNSAADISGHPELANAPLCMTGWSRGAFDTCYLAMAVPERVITIVPMSGGVWSADSDTAFKLRPEALNVPVLFLASSEDTNTLTNPYAMKQMFQRWRNSPLIGAGVARRGLAAFATNWGAAHSAGGNQGWEMAMAWMVEVVNLRYPRPQVPSITLGKLPALITLEERSGWLADNDAFSAAVGSNPPAPAATNIFTSVERYADYGGSVATSSWIPTKTLALAYRAITSTDRVKRTAVPNHSPLRVVSPSQFADPFIAGQPVTFEVDPRDFDNGNGLVAVEFYDGDVLLGTDSAGPEWKWTFAPAPGVHTLNAIAIDTQGNHRAAFRTLYVQAANFPPIALPSRRAIVAGTSLIGNLVARDPEGSPIVGYAVSQSPRHGSLTLDAITGSFTYTPDSGYTGEDSFGYTASDGLAISASAEVAISISLSTPQSISTLVATAGPYLNEITVEWPASAHAAGYAVERSPVSANDGFITIATLKELDRGYIDSNLTLATTYYYRIRAFNGLGSTYSNAVSAKPLSSYLPVGEITSFTRTPADAGAIGFVWSAAQNASAYEVQISSDGGISFQPVASVSALARYYAKPFQIWRRYLFRVRGVNPSYLGAWTEILAATPDTPPGFDNWAQANVGAGGSARELLDVPFGDGVANLLRYALGYHLTDDLGRPHILRPDELPITSLRAIDGSDYLILSFQHNPNATDLVFCVQVASDLSGPWEDLDPFISENQISRFEDTPRDGVETIIVRDTQPLTAGGKRFMRLRVTK